MAVHGVLVKLVDCALKQIKVTLMRREGEELFR